MSDLCPKCGAGVISQDERGVLFQLRKGWPVTDYPCDECERRSRERMMELGKQMAERDEKMILDQILVSDSAMKSLKSADSIELRELD